MAHVVSLTFPESAGSGKISDVRLSSDIESVIVGEENAVAERSASVTLTTQSAVWYPGTENVWPNL